MFGHVIKYTILVPVLMPDGDALVPPSVLTNVRSAMAAHFGGTVVAPQVSGSWFAKDGTRVDEPMILVWSLTTDESAPAYQDEDFMEALAQDVAAWTDQEYVLVTAEVAHAMFVPAPSATVEAVA
jgi:hypothetical protein